MPAKAPGLNAKKKPRFRGYQRLSSRGAEIRTRDLLSPRQAR